jgi:hypothetical protein
MPPDYRVALATNWNEVTGWNDSLHVTGVAHMVHCSLMKFQGPTTRETVDIPVVRVVGERVEAKSFPFFTVQEFLAVEFVQAVGELVVGSTYGCFHFSKEPDWS